MISSRFIPIATRPSSPESASLGLLASPLGLGAIGAGMGQGQFALQRFQRRGQHGQGTLLPHETRTSQVNISIPPAMLP